MRLTVVLASIGTVAVMALLAVAAAATMGPSDYFILLALDAVVLAYCASRNMWMGFLPMLVLSVQLGPSAFGGGLMIERAIGGLWLVLPVFVVVRAIMTRSPFAPIGQTTK